MAYAYTHYITTLAEKQAICGESPNFRLFCMGGFYANIEIKD